MHDAADHHPMPLSLADQEPLRDEAGTPRRGECPFLARLSRAARQLRRWLVGTPAGRRTQLEIGPLDDNTLNDIGMARIEMLFSGPK
jgi:uncharacterized protein YjiS (DUF1127 family)